MKPSRHCTCLDCPVWLCFECSTLANLGAADHPSRVGFDIRLASHVPCLHASHCQPITPAYVHLDQRTCDSITAEPYSFTIYNTPTPCVEFHEIACYRVFAREAPLNTGCGCWSSSGACRCRPPLAPVPVLFARLLVCSFAAPSPLPLTALGRKKSFQLWSLPTKKHQPSGARPLHRLYNRCKQDIIRNNGRPNCCHKE